MCERAIYMYLSYFPLVFWRNHRSPSIIFGAAGASTDNFGGIICISDFSENPKIKKHIFPSVPRHGFRRNSAQSMRNRCPAMSQPICFPYMFSYICFPICFPICVTVFFPYMFS